MSSRNIAVQAQVYEALDRERRGGESFTSVLRRLLKDRQSVEDLAGAWGSPPRNPSSPRAHPASRRRSGGSR